MFKYVPNVYDLEPLTVVTHSSSKNIPIQINKLLTVKSQYR